MTRMELECIMLNETSQSEKENYHTVVSLMWNLETRQISIGTK